MNKIPHFPEDFRKAVVERVVRSQGYHWCAHDDIVDFFAEVVDLEQLPSNDSRYGNARADLQAHTIWNEDYELVELLADARFDPMLMTDEQFKRFVETGLRHDIQAKTLAINEAGRYAGGVLDGQEASPLADLLRPMFRSLGLDLAPKVEFGIEVGFQIVAGRVEANNQGRGHSSNPGPLEYQGLRFRSKVEVDLFKALFAADYLIAPLPVFLHKPTRRRVEPDFVVVKFGIWAIIEIDGTAWHNESPVEAARRLEPFTDESVRIIRFSDDALSTPEGRKQAVTEIERKFENWQKSR